MDDLASEGLQATAQGLFASFAFGLGGCLGSLWAGALFETMGMPGLYAMSTGLSLGATLLYYRGTQQAKAPSGVLPAEDLGR